MNILYITRAYGQHGGGMERLSFELARELKQQANVDITVLAHVGARATSPFFVFTITPRALAAARKSDAILLGDPMLSLVGWLITLFIHKPVAVIVHGLDITFNNWLYKLYLRLFFRNLDAYFPISQSVNTNLEHVPVRGRRAVITPGISDRFYDPSITRGDLLELLLNTYNLQLTNQKILLTVGRLVHRKGHAWFIKNVLPHLPENYVYLIAGDGPERERLKGKERVILLGKVSDQQLKILYNTVDAFIQPNIPVSGDVEGFGLVMLEAALCNRPVFASHIDGIPDAIHDGHSGRLLPPSNAQAWIQALTHELPAPQLRKEARAYTHTHHSWPGAAGKLLNQLKIIARQ